MVTPTYPGVYIEEIPSGVHTITGVASSITAFIGRALRGPTDEAVFINSFSDFERIFGGLWEESTLGYAVRDFYMNGGSQAVIVRLFHSDLNHGGKDKAKIEVEGLKLIAANQGSWGANLRASIDADVSEEVAKGLGLNKEVIFNLTVWESTPGGAVETFPNLTTKKESYRRIDEVLKAESKLVFYDDYDPDTPPDINAVYNKLEQAQKAVDNQKAIIKALESSEVITNAQSALEDTKKRFDAVQALLNLYKAPDFKAVEDALKLTRKVPVAELANKIITTINAMEDAKGKLAGVKEKFSTHLGLANQQLDENQSTLAAENVPENTPQEEIKVNSAIAIVVLAKQAVDRLTEADRALGDAVSSLNSAKGEADKKPPKFTKAIEEILNAETSLTIAQTEWEASRQSYVNAVKNAKEEFDAATKSKDALCNTNPTKANVDLKEAEKRLTEAGKA